MINKFHCSNSILDDLDNSDCYFLLILECFAKTQHKAL